MIKNISSASAKIGNSIKKFTFMLTLYLCFNIILCHGHSILKSPMVGLSSNTNKRMEIRESTLIKTHSKPMYSNVTNIGCFNGGVVYNNTNGKEQCKCAYGYGGDKCRDIHCENGGDYSEDTNSCICPKKWNGNKCTMCKSDDVCPNGEKCEKNAPITNIRKINARCDVVDEDIANTFGNVIEITSAYFNSENNDETSKINAVDVAARATNLNGNATVFAYGWKVSKTDNNVRTDPTIFCEMGSCKIISKEQEQEGHIVDKVECSTTSCDCIGEDTINGVCNKYIKNMVKSINGKTTVTCINSASSSTPNNPKGSSCNVKFFSLSWTTLLKCESSSCVEHITPTEPPIGSDVLLANWISKISNNWKYYWVVTGSLLFLLSISAFLGIVVDCSFQARNKYEMKNLARNTSFTIEVKNLSYYITKHSAIFRFLPWVPNFLRSYILKDISFTINKSMRKSHMHIIIGNSGEGKTTLLKCLSNVKKEGSSTGTIKINGRSILNSNIKSISSISYDNEIFNSASTVYEVLKFTALMKGAPIRTINLRINQILMDLEITHLRWRRIGSSSSHNLSTGDLKRLIVANALISHPKILILDEPTSGLDDVTGSKVIQVLKKYSKDNNAVVIIVAHSIGGFCYKMFDGVTIMAKRLIIESGYRSEVDKIIKNRVNSRIISDPYVCIQNYISDINYDPSIQNYDSKNKEESAPLLSENETEEIELQDKSANELDELDNISENNNPIIDNSNNLKKSDNKKETSGEKVSNHINQTRDEEIKNVKEKILIEVDISDEKTNRSVNLSSSSEFSHNWADSDVKFSSPYSVAFFTQFIHLLGRDLKMLVRKTDLLLLQLLIYVFSAIFLSTFANSLNNDIPGCQTRIGVLALMILIVSFASVGSVWRIYNEFDQMVKETDTALYHPWVYLTSKIITDFLIMRIAPTIIFCCIVYTSMGAMADYWWIYVYKYTILCLVFSIISMVSAEICLAISFILPSPLVFTVIMNIVLILLSITNGVFINKEVVRSGVNLIFYASPIKYATESLFVNEFLGSTVIINPKEFKNLNISVSVDGKFYLNQMSLDSTAMEMDIFVLSMFFFVFLLVLYPLFSLSIYLRKKK